MLWLYTLGRRYSLSTERNFRLSFIGMLWFMILVSWVENRSICYRADGMRICAWNLDVWKSGSVYGERQRRTWMDKGEAQDPLSLCLFCWSVHQKHPEAKLRPVPDFYLFAHFYCMHVCVQDACGEGTCVRGWWENNFVEFKDRIWLSSLAQQVPSPAEPSRQPLDFYF